MSSLTLVLLHTVKSEYQFIGLLIFSEQFSQNFPKDGRASRRKDALKRHSTEQTTFKY